MRDNIIRKQKKWMWRACILLLVLVVYFLWEFNRDMEKAEQRRNEEMLKSLAEQGAFVAENRLTSTISILETAARLLDPATDMHDPETLKYLKSLAEDGEMDRIGLADADGNVCATDGFSENAYERKYFQASMRGETYISTIYFSQFSNEECIVISVPVRDKNENVRGVIYGVILTRHFNIYAQSRLNPEVERRVYIIDKNGNYLVRAMEQSRAIQDTQNFFELLEGTNLKKEEIVQKIVNNESAFYSIVKEGEVRTLFLAPMSVNDWCVVTILSGEDGDVSINSFRTIVFFLMVKILLSVIVLTLIGYYINYKEKALIKKLNSELMIKEKIFQMAVTEANGYVFTYNMEKRELEFLNYDDKNEEHFPKILHNFPDSLPDFILPYSAAHKKIMEILDELHQGAENVEGDISLELNRVIIHYHLNLVRLSKEDSPEQLVIGAMVNVTEERQNEVYLRNQAGRDPLTMLYNRLAATEQIDKALQNHDNTTCAFLILDLDNFKRINDTFGHLMGDQVLVDVAEILQSHVRSRDVVCRLGGDEFVVFFVNIPLHVIEKNIGNLIKKLNKIYEKDGMMQRCAASGGVALVPRDGTSFQELYEKADQALYRIKKQGKNGFALYDEEKDGHTIL